MSDLLGDTVELSPSSGEAHAPGPSTDPLRSAAGLLAEAESRGISLRLLGSGGVILHCEHCSRLCRLLNREPPGDLDFAGYARESGQIVSLFHDLGFEDDPTVAHSQEFGTNRLIYQHAINNLKVDVFLDLLRMSHTLQFKHRLELRSRTLTAEDLLLSKLQIHALTDKDILDIVTLLGAHGPGIPDRDSIDMGYILRILRTDWGWYHTAELNLHRVHQYVASSNRVRTIPYSAVQTQVTDFLGRMAREPKTLSWKVRSAIGARVPWYEDVEEVHR